MRSRVRRWRWRIARLVAPQPIMVDPFPGEKATWITARENGVTVQFRAATLEMKLTSRFPTAAEREAAGYRYVPSRREGTFSGTFA